MRKLILTASLLMVAAAGEAKSAQSQSKQGLQSTEVSSDELGVATDAPSFKEIFESNLLKSKTEISESRERYEMEFALASNTISDAVLQNDYFEISYSDQVSSHSMIRFYAAYAIPLAASIVISPEAGLGYTFQENILLAKSKKGGLYKDVVRVQWVPAHVGAKVGYRLPNLKGSSVFFRGGASYEWVSVSGSLDGISQSYWAPSILGSVGLTVFEDELKNIDSWFGGMSLSGGISQPGSDKGIRSTWIELGMRILL